MDQLRAFQALGMGNPFRYEKNMPGRFKDVFTNILEQPEDSIFTKVKEAAPIVQKQKQFEEDTDKNRQILDNKEFFSGNIDEVIKQSTPVKVEKGVPGGGDENMFANVQGNDEQVTDIDAKQLMKENAELFKELLGESNKKKLKDARIGDVSDYLLKFFEGSQKEGATVGSSAADVAAFATAKDSRTEKAKQAIEKQDQTAIALAINDYIAGKRSKEQIDALTAKSDLALSNKLAVIQLAKEDLAANIIEAGKGGALGSQKLIQGIKSTPSLKGKGIEQFSSEKGESVQYESGYENKVFIDTDTETIFTFDPTGNKISLY